MKIKAPVKYLGEIYKSSLLAKRLMAVLSIDVLFKFSGIILLPVYLRLMTQDEYGFYNYIISIILTLSLILNFGLYVPLGKYYHDLKTSDEKGEYLFTTFLQLAATLAVILLPLYLLKGDFFVITLLFKTSFHYEKYRLIILTALLISVLQFMLSSFFYTSEKIRVVQTYNVFRIIFINGAAIIALISFANHSAVQTRLGSVYLTESVLFIFFIYFLLTHFRYRFNRKYALANFKLGLPIMLSAIFGLVINFSDKFFLEKYSSLKSLSTYYLAFSIVSVIPTIISSFQNAWLPIFFKEKDLENRRKKTNKIALRLAVLFLALSSLILLAFKLALLSNIIPDKYREAQFILPILLITQIAAALTPMYSNHLISFEKTYIISATGLLLAAISIILNYFFIPKYGIYAAATNSLICNCLYLLIYFFMVKFFISRQHLPLINLL